MDKSVQSTTASHISLFLPQWQQVYEVSAISMHCEIVANTTLNSRHFAFFRARCRIPIDHPLVCFMAELAPVACWYDSCSHS